MGCGMGVRGVGGGGKSEGDRAGGDIVRER